MLVAIPCLALAAQITPFFFLKIRLVLLFILILSPVVVSKSAGPLSTPFFIKLQGILLGALSLWSPILPTFPNPAREYNINLEVFNLCLASLGALTIWGPIITPSKPFGANLTLT